MAGANSLGLPQISPQEFLRAYINYCPEGLAFDSLNVTGTNMRAFAIACAAMLYEVWLDIYGLATAANFDEMGLDDVSAWNKFLAIPNEIFEAATNLSVARTNADVAMALMRQNSWQAVADAYGVAVSFDFSTPFQPVVIFESVTAGGMPSAIPTGMGGADATTQKLVNIFLAMAPATDKVLFQFFQPGVIMFGTPDPQFGTPDPQFGEQIQTI